MNRFLITAGLLIILVVVLLTFVPVSATSGASAFVTGGGNASGLGGIIVG